MLSVTKLIASALECLGWPYESPGNNDRSGIDCSGLWVKCFRDQGSSIYHGSNTIFHDYCTRTEKLTSVSQLKPGMAVFKCKAWTDADKRNKWHGKPPGNLSHIGMVTSVNPLVITHATSPVCTQDFKLGQWAYCGYVRGVDYGFDPVPSPDPEPVPEPVPEPEGKTMIVTAENGKPVNFRTGPSIKRALVAKIALGETVTVYGQQGEWSQAKYRSKTGWMMSKYLRDPEEPAADPEPVPVLPGTTATVWSANGKPVKLRNKPTTGTSLYDMVPINTVVTVEEYGEKWCRVSYGYRRGWYMMTEYLTWG